jgi:acyl-CoA reductase-like NAD-dependent aldehyde dehydrogenase
MRIAELLQTVLPAGVLEVVAGSGAAAGIALTAHPLVKKISFTGSSPAGKAVLKQAAGNLTPCLMELGGKNNFIILPGCDLDKAVPAAHEGAFYNNGQACTATSRILVHRPQHDEFVEKLARSVKRTRVGDGADEKVHVGPLVNLAQQQKVLEYIGVGLSEGAVIAAQGELPRETRLKNGYFVPPTLFTQVKPGMRIAQEEIFGPVVCVLSYEDVAEAVKIANDTEYGLIAVVYGQDAEEAWRVARQMDVGSVYINNFYRAGKNCVPFGGNKGSGFGRERSIETLREFGRSKTVKTVSGIGKIPVWSIE